MWEFIEDRHAQILLNAWNHFYLVVLALIFATVIGVSLAVFVTRFPKLTAVFNSITVVGLTIPSFALIGLVLPQLKLGTGTALFVVTFYAALPILRNAVVGLAGVDKTLIESATGMGMNDAKVLFKIRLPLAWPIIHTGLRVSGQMSMGVAAIAAYVLGPGLGTFIFTGLTAGASSKNGLNSALVGTIGVVIIALILDALLQVLGRFTISKGIRA